MDEGVPFGESYTYKSAIGFQRQILYGDFIYLRLKNRIRFIASLD